MHKVYGKAATKAAQTNGASDAEDDHNHELISSALFCVMRSIPEEIPSFRDHLVERRMKPSQIYGCAKENC